MSKRFHDTDIWSEDWFIALKKDYRFFWLHIKDDCDHAGIWRPKIAGFNKMYNCNIDLDRALDFFNSDRRDDKRVIVLKNGRWFLTGFIPFQYGTVLNLASPMHKSIYGLLIENEVNLTFIRPQVEVRGRVKDKDKDKDSNKEGGVGETEELEPDLSAPILYLNEKAKRTFDPKNEGNRDFVRARYNEGRTLEDFKKVIDKKVS